MIRISTRVTWFPTRLRNGIAPPGFRTPMVMTFGWLPAPADAYNIVGIVLAIRIRRYDAGAAGQRTNAWLIPALSAAPFPRLTA